MLHSCSVSFPAQRVSPSSPSHTQAISWDPAILEQKRFIKAQGPEITYDVLQVIRGARKMVEGGGRIGEHVP